MENNNSIIEQEYIRREIIKSEENIRKKVDNFLQELGKDYYGSDEGWRLSSCVDLNPMIKQSIIKITSPIVERKARAKLLEVGKALFEDLNKQNN